MRRSAVDRFAWSGIITMPLARWDTMERSSSAHPGGPLRAQSAPSVPEAQRPLFDLLGVQEAWELAGPTAETCRIGVVDTGFDFFHPGLRHVLRPDFYADGVHHTSVAGVQGHGTAVAGLMVARLADPDSGAVGLASGCEGVAASIGTLEHALLLLLQRVRQENLDATEADVRREMMAHASEIQTFGLAWAEHVARSTAAGIRSLVDADVSVINLSLFLPTALLSRTPEGLRDLEESFAYARRHDVLLVLGAGNDGAVVADYPGEPDGVLVVGATNLDDTPWDTTAVSGGVDVRQASNRSPQLDVVAPSRDLRVLQPHEAGLYGVRDTPLGAPEQEWDGAYADLSSGATSMATAVASSLAGLVRAARPDATVDEVIEIITATARDLGPEGWDDVSGHGRVDFAAALRAAARRTP